MWDVDQAGYDMASTASMRLKGLGAVGCCYMTRVQDWRSITSIIGVRKETKVHAESGFTVQIEIARTP